ncbi:hypothetical protein C7382_101197 [Porphyromonas loveana]|uniref:Uncharacterized protein n=1 Tax=Porphyromonas loveana TaxID=1884669 RepID=A0A2U1FT22_9PORP|nr:hypothetical protein C7382_101197 [Porphyromonas loveana]
MSILDKELKNHFLSHCSSTKSRKMIFSPKNRRQRAEKSFFESLSTVFWLKNGFSAFCSQFFNRKMLFLLFVHQRRCFQPFSRLSGIDCISLIVNARLIKCRYISDRTPLKKNRTSNSKMRSFGNASLNILRSSIYPLNSSQGSNINQTIDPERSSGTEPRSNVSF